MPSKNKIVGNVKISGKSTTGSSVKHSKKNKDTFGVQWQKQDKNVGKKVAVAAAAALLAASTLAIPAVIYYVKNFGYQVRIESVLDYDNFSAKTKKLKRGATIGDIEHPNIPGHYFDGYFTSTDFREENRMDNDTKIQDDITVYLHYVSIRYRLDFSGIQVGCENELAFTLKGEQLTEDSILSYDDEFIVTVNEDAGYKDSLYIDGTVETTASKINSGQQIPSNQHYFKVVAGNMEESDQLLLVHFSREVLRFTATFFNWDGSSQTMSELAYNTAIPAPQVKHRENSVQYTYTFLGWAEANSMGEPINFDDDGQPIILTQQEFEDGAIMVKSDNVFYVAMFDQQIQHYQLTIEADPPAVAECVHIFIDGKLNTDKDEGQIALYNIKYGSKVTVTYEEREGWQRSVFTLNGQEQLGNSITIESMECDLVVRYEEIKRQYTIGAIPNGVTVTKQQEDGSEVPVKSYDTIYHFDRFTFHYDLLEGHHLRTFVVNGKPLDNNSTLEVTGAVNIIFIQEIDTFNIGEIPSQVYVAKKDGSRVISNQTLDYGTTVTITYTESDGYNKTRFAINGEQQENGYELVVYADVTIEYEEELKTYKMGDIPKNVSVVRENGEKVEKGSTLTHFEKLTISYFLDEGYHLNDFSVNGQRPSNNKNTLDVVVTGEVTIAFEQAINTYMVIFMDENRSSELERVSVNWGEKATPSVEPTKKPDLIFNYTFDKWLDDEGTEVDLNHITKSITVYASYSRSYIEYTIELPESDCVTLTFISGNSKHSSNILTKDDKLYYGDKVRVSYVQSTGYTRSMFRINGNNVSVGITSMEVTINGNLSVEYQEDINVYKMLEIPAGVTVTREDGSEVKTGDDITHFEKLTLHYTLNEGYEAEFKVDGEIKENNYQHTVEGQFKITFHQTIKKYTVGEIPEGVTVMRGEEQIHTGDQLTYNDKIVISYAESVGKHKVTFKVNGKDVDNNYSLTVKGTISIVYVEEYDVFRMLQIPKGVTVTRQSGAQVNEGDSITYDELLTVTYALEEGYHRTRFVVDGQSVEDGLTSTTVKVTKAFEIIFTQEINTYTVHFYDEYEPDGAAHLEDVKVEWGKGAIAKTPTKTGNEIFNYEFEYWANEAGERVDVDSVKSDLIVYAHYAEKYVEYNLVVSSDNDNIIIKYLSGSSKYDQNQILTAQNTVHYGDTILISYTTTIGHTKNSFIVNNKEEENDVTIEVKGEVTVTYQETINQYTVVFYNYNGSELQRVSVAHGGEAKFSGKEPTKESDKEYTYSFAGWGDKDSDDILQLTNITEDRDFYAKYTQNYREYSISIPNSNVSVMFVSGKSDNSGILSNQNKLYYGDIINITRTASAGKKESAFSVVGLEEQGDNNYKVVGDVAIVYNEIYIDYSITIPSNSQHITIEYVRGSSSYYTNQRLSNGNTVHYDDVLRITFTSSQGHSGKMSVDGATVQEDDLYIVFNDITIVYEEDYIDYNIVIPDGVSVTLRGQQIYNGAKVHIGDELNVSYTLKPGHHLEEFSINSQAIATQTTTFTVGAQDVNIVFRSAINTYTISFPKQVTVLRDGVALNSGDTVEYNQSLNITYQETPGYRKTYFDYSYGLTPADADNVYTVTALENGTPLEIYYNEESIEYSITIPDGVSVKYVSGGNPNYTEGSPIVAGNTLHYNDIIEISYQLGEDMALNYFTVNSKSVSNNYNHTVTENVKITFDEVHSYLEFYAISNGWEVGGLKDYSVTSITIPSTYKGKQVLQIANNAFKNTDLQQVVINNGILKINDQAFNGCKNLTQLQLPASVTSIGNSAFKNCAISSLQLNGVLTIGDSAFAGNSQLSQVEFGKGLSTLGNSAFANCPTLTQITIPASVNTIGDAAFNNCAGLNNVTLSSGLKNIGANAFSSTAISSITIPNTVVQIGENAFANCSNLTNVTIDSAQVYNAVSDVSADHLISNAQYVRVLKTAADSEGSSNNYLNSKNFRKTEDGKYYLFTIASELECTLTIIGADNVTVTFISGLGDYAKDDELFSGDTIHIGDVVKITYTEDIGHHKTVFTVNGQDFTSGREKEVDGNLNIEFAQQLNEHILNINTNAEITVSKNGKALSSGDTIYYGDELILEYTTTIGKSADFSYNGLTHLSGNRYRVSLTANNLAVDVNYYENWIDYHVTIPQHVSVKYVSGSCSYAPNSNLDSLSIVHYGDTINISCQPEQGYSTATFTVNDKEFNSGNNLTVEGDVVIVYEQEVDNYEISAIPNYVTVTFEQAGDIATSLNKGDELDENSVLHYGDTIKLHYQHTGYTFKSFTVNTQTFNENDLVYLVTDNITTLEVAEQINTYTLSFPTNLTVNKGSPDGQVVKSGVAGNVSYGDILYVSWQVPDGKQNAQVTAVGLTLASGQNTASGCSFKVTEENNSAALSLIYTDEYIEYSLTINDADPGNLSITYVQGTSSQHTKDKVLHAGDTLHYGDSIRITYVESAGFHNTKFEVKGATQSNDVYTVNKNVDVTYEEAINVYTVEFYDEKQAGVADRLLGSTTVNWNESAEYNHPSKNSDNTYDYTFDKWTLDGTADATDALKNVQLPHNGDTLKVYAAYKSTYIEYSLTINDADPSNLSITYVQGTSSQHTKDKVLQAGDTLHYDDEIKITYKESAGHTKSKFEVTGADAGESNIYTVKTHVSVTYEETINKYTVKFFNYDGSGDPIYTTTVEYNNTAQFVGTNPTRVSDETFTYTFVGWAKTKNANEAADSFTITEDTNFYAAYRADYIPYYVSDFENIVIIYVDGSSDYIPNTPLTSDMPLHYNDTIKIAYYNSEEELESFKINNNEYVSQLVENTITLKITENITSIEVAEAVYLIFTHLDNGGYRVDGIKTTKLNKITNLEIPDTYQNENVVEVNEGAFEDNTTITSITIGKNIAAIGAQAFYNCASVTQINFNATNCADLTYSSKVFNNVGANGKGVSLVFGDEVTKIPAYLFMPNDSRGSTGKSVSSAMGEEEFTAAKITSITIGKGVTTIGDRAFNYCTELTQINFNAVKCEDLWDSFSLEPLDVFDFGVGQSSDGINVVFGEDVTRIPAYLFYYASGDEYATNLKSVTIGQNVTSIGRGAFLNCANLTKITIPENVITISDLAFAGCVNLETVDLSQAISLKELGGFDGCSSLTEIIVPENVTTIGEYAFANCENLKTVDLTNAKKLQIIREHAFDYCSRLNNITIPENVNKIGFVSMGTTHQGFKECRRLDDVTINSAAVYNDPDIVFDLLMYATTVRVLKSAVNNSNPYLEDETRYTRTEGSGEWEDYYIYTRIG